VNIRSGKSGKKFEETDFDENVGFTMFKINKVLRNLKPNYSPVEG